MDDGDDAGEYRLFGMQVGVVQDRQDPLGLGRVRVAIQGITDSSGWAWPLGVGTGAPSRGIFFVPDVGAAVAVWFLRGNLDVPYYMPAQWGSTPGSGDEVPTPVKAVPPADRPAMKALETEAFLIELDNRDGVEILRISRKEPDNAPPENYVEIDGAGKGIVIKALAELRIECDGRIDINALDVRVNNRPIADSPDTI